MLSIVIQLLASLSLLVFVHELGHYIMARIFGVKVDKFYLFFDAGGKALFRYKPKNSSTEFGIGWLPLGGYCKISGMIDESLDTEQMKREPSKEEFRSKPAWQRFFIMFGGVLFNVILAIFIYAGISYHWGRVELTSDLVHSGMAFAPVAKDIGFQDGDIILSIDGEKEDVLDQQNFTRKVIGARYVQVLRGEEKVDIRIPEDMMKRVLRTQQGVLTPQMPFVVDSVFPNSPASAAGIMPGDSLIAVNGTQTPDIRDAQKMLQTLSNNSITLTMSSKGAIRDYQVQVDSTGIIGVQLKHLTEIYPVSKIKYNLLTAIPAGIKQGVNTIRSYVGDMKYVFTKEGASQIGGFGTIGSLFPKQFNWFLFWNITALISIILAVMNLLPIPALDGGHIMFLLYEMFTGRKVSESFMIKAQIVGMILLLILILYANANDVVRFLIR
ncbi:Metalloprotease mmpA [Porphyromonas macacae]|uniref:Zinc metalloprotease n=1 Tax=Porphyromonas macacae TaxID=28115 RepID=A0A379EA59_9PORP|nr:RIP metalloprotease RseP [Porphyromonas macacae]SUB89419.1 Metalloprotease mmpA [Porphyromonas macacae]